MQKKLIALAVAGLASTAAFAQSNVTIYGRADFGFMNRGQDSGGLQNQINRAEFGSGLQAGSRLGFRGAEDLGNGLKAIFEVEFGYGIDQTAAPYSVAPATATAGGAVTTAGAGTRAAVSRGTDATWQNRHSYVGLSGGFGTIVGGRLDGVRYGIYNAYDPFAGGTVGNFTQMTAQVDRADNAVAYISPNFSGFTLTAAYSSNIAGAEGLGAATAAAPTTARGNDKDNRLNTIMLGYDNGPISAKLDYEQIITRGFSDDDRAWVATAAGSYDFGVVKVSALYDQIKSDANSALRNNLTEDRRNWLVGVRAPIGKFTVKANYGRTDDRTTANLDANKYAIGLDYALSKRTNLYTDYGRIQNKHGAAFGISAAANGSSAASQLGAAGFDIGIAHNF